jgi:hypothetical protein
MSDTGGEEIDWSLTTWEGARREQMRRWAALPLENIVAALEEMQEITDWLHPERAEADEARSAIAARPTRENAKR